MPHLSDLTLTAATPRQQLSPLAHKRRKLIEQIDLQLRAAEAELADDEFVQEIRRWVRVEGSNDKQLVTQRKPVRRWWWKNESGDLMLSLRLGNRLMQVAEGQWSIQVGAPTELPQVLQTLRKAIAEGELDQQLEQVQQRSPSKVKVGQKK